MDTGFVLLYRSLMESPIFNNEKWLKVWIWCLLKAKHKTGFVSMSSGKGTQSILVERGQFIFGRNKAAEELSIDANALYSIIKKFESRFKLIAINSNNQYSIITICNYDSYQDVKKRSQQPNNNQTTRKQQGNNTYNTGNTGNEGKEGDNIYIGFDGLKEEDIQRWQKFNAWFKTQNFGIVSRIAKQLTPQEFIKLYNEYGGQAVVDILIAIENKKDSATKYSSVYLTSMNWLKRNRDQQAA